MINPWVIVAALAIAITTVSGAYIKGRSDGVDIERAERAGIEEVARVARQEAAISAARAISQIELKHTVIRQEVQREIIEKPVYRDCLHTPGVMRLINSALTGSQPASDSELPVTNPVER